MIIALAAVLGYFAFGAFLFWALMRLHQYVNPALGRPDDTMFWVFVVLWPIMTFFVLTVIASDSDFSASSLVMNFFDTLLGSIKDLLT